MNHHTKEFHKIFNNKNIDELERLICHDFKDKNLLLSAITHPGFEKNEKNKLSSIFEKLEFLGDRVLGLALADFLFHHFPKENEGELATRIATLAGTDFLINLAKKTEIIKYFRIPKDFYISSHKNSSSIADMMEALFGAVFLDSNFETVQKVILNIYKNDAEKIVYKQKDSKTFLQEITQAKAQTVPQYRLLKVVGEVHNPIFEIEVSACDLTAIGQGNSKRKAEHDAASHILKKLGYDF